MALSNATIKVVFNDDTEKIVPGVYGYSYAAAPTPWSRGNYRDEFDVDLATAGYSRLGALVVYAGAAGEVSRGFVPDGTALTASVNDLTASSVVAKLPDSLDHEAPRTRTEAVVLLQFLDNASAVIAQFETNELRGWYKSA